MTDRETAAEPATQSTAGAGLYSLATGVRRSGVFAAILLIAIPFGVVLLSACANVANMMRWRARSLRQREIGIRLSLGAGRARLIQQLLTEAMLLALPAALLGFGIAQGMIEIGERVLFATLPANFLEYIRIAPLAPDARVFGFVLAAAIVAALLFGLAPAIQVTRLNIMQAAHGEFSGQFQSSRLRNGLVVAQVTVSAMFLIVCGVFLRGANHVRSLDTGMRTRDVLEIELQEKSRAKSLAKLAAIPGVSLLAAAAHPPLDSTLPNILATAADRSVRRCGCPILTLRLAISRCSTFRFFAAATSRRKRRGRERRSPCSAKLPRESFGRRGMRLGSSCDYPRVTRW